MNIKISDDYKLMCARAAELQKMWFPSIGDYIIAKASYCGGSNQNCTDSIPCDDCIKNDNIFVIDNSFNYAESIGGTYWFFGSTLCSKDGGCITRDTCCSVITKNGIKNKYGNYDAYPLSDFLWIPKLNQLICMLTIQEFYKYFKKSKGYIGDRENDLEINTLFYLMDYKYKKHWSLDTKEWKSKEGNK